MAKSNLQHYSRVIGIDVHKELFVCHAMLKDSDGKLQEEEQRFGTFHKDIRDVCSWVESWQPEIITMESTGIYWEPLAWTLRDAGFPVNVVNARHVKALRGHKTDSKDAAWLATISFLCTTNRSFIPTQEYREYRRLERARVNFVGDLQRVKNRRSKILEEANIKLSSVFSDLSGKNARIVIHGLIEQKPAEKIVSALNFRRLKADKQRVLDALAGDLGDTGRKILSDYQENIESLEQKIQEYTQLMIDCVKRSCPDHFYHLKTIPGISDASAASILIEIGGGVGAFPSAKQFASWIAICPGNHESAGKRYSGKTRKGNKYLRRILIECAQALCRSKSSLGSKALENCSRLGWKKGIVATAHKLARIIYAIINNCVEYRDDNIDYEQMLTCRRVERNIRKIADATGASVTIHRNDTGEVISSAEPRIPYQNRPESQRILIAQLLPGVVK